ncbi:MAG: DEDD exonuclease domain-containing protein [Acidimicrobiia bacterium]
MVQRSFEELGAPLHEVPFCVVDLETTGGAASRDAITEIGALRYQAGELQGTFHTLVNPNRQIPATITILTGITHAMVVEAPPIAEVLPTFFEFLSDAVVVGHNVRFDLGFLNTAAEELGYGRLPNRAVDTLGLARRLLAGEVRRLSLSSLAAHFRSPQEPTHRALDDAHATAHVFHGLLERAGTIGVTALEDLLQLPTARGSPHYQKISLTELLPRRAGVYEFLDRNDEVFYVGKAKNLRTRVRSYFYGDGRRSVTNMLRELRRIEHRVCETELEASVTELRLIQSHRPRFNVRSKPPRSVHYVKLTDETFPRLSLARKVRDQCLYLGPFRSRRAAEQVQLALWDALPIRRCRGKARSRSGPCQFAQLGVAYCPCDGSLAAEEYGHVVGKLREGIETWPAVLLDPLAARMSALAGEQRFEEAAWARDRYRALARAIERRRAWRTLIEAGLLRLERRSGEGALVDRARLVASWADGNRPPLLPVEPDDEEGSQVPLTWGAAEEAELIWRWLTGEQATVVDATGVVAHPIGSIPDLQLAG